MNSTLKKQTTLNNNQVKPGGQNIKRNFSHENRKLTFRELWRFLRYSGFEENQQDSKIN